ncbi:MAG: lipopolysaccharide biosynthesis [Bryobacterales bacterium]|nr:lipopolysaccharide biosynthesis [Bryobacterales bacterium]
MEKNRPGRALRRRPQLADYESRLVAASANGAALPPPAELDNEALPNYFAQAWRKKGVIAGIGFVVVLFTLGLTVLQTPIYEARVNMELLAAGGAFWPFRDGAPPSAVNDMTIDSSMQTQVLILHSETLLGHVADKLKLYKRPEFNVRSGLHRYFPSLPKLMRQPEDTPRQRALKSVVKNLGVRHEARIIEISFDSKDPVLAAAVVNALADEYIRQYQDANGNAARRISEELFDQAKVLDKTLDDFEQQTQKYARNSGIVFTGERENAAEESLRSLGDEVARAKAERIAKQAQYEVSTRSKPEDTNQVADDATLREYQIRLTDLTRQLEQMSLLLTPTNYKVQQIQSQLKVVQDAIHNQVVTIRKRWDNDYKIALSRENQLVQQYSSQSANVAEITAKSVHYNTLKQELESIRTLRDGMLQKAKELSIASQVPATDVRVVGKAAIPTRPYKPSYSLNMSVGLFGGCFLGLLVALGRERYSPVIQTPGQTSSFLRMPELAAIPDAKGKPMFPLQAARLKRLWLAPRAEVVSEPRQSIVKNSFYDAVASLSIHCRWASPVILMTSPGIGDGKTTVTANLGIALANTNRRVLLIDGNVHRPRLHTIFNVAKTPGLSDWLRVSVSASDEFPLAAAVNIAAVPNLYLLPGGDQPPDSALFYNKRLPALIAEFREQFDVILIDTPAVLQNSDARLLGGLAHGAILVLRCGSTAKAAASAAAERLRADRVNVVGTILNACPAGAGHLNQRPVSSRSYSF